jgi:hypothetical protein
MWLAFVLMIFQHPKAKILYGELSCKKKMLATLQASFLFFATSSLYKTFRLRMMKYCQH